VPGAILFAISVVGIFLNRKNIIVLLMAIERMLLAVNMNFVAFSHYPNDRRTDIRVFIPIVAAAESPTGLAILVVLSRNLNTINAKTPTNLKGKQVHEQWRAAMRTAGNFSRLPVYLLAHSRFSPS
jgi:NADH-quinone oxidoreductase subunit K